MQEKRWCVWVCIKQSLQQYKRVQIAFRHCVLQSLLNGIKVAGWSFDCIRQMRAIFSWENCHLIKLPSTLVQPNEWARERACEHECERKGVATSKQEERVKDKSGRKNIRCVCVRRVIGVLVLCCKFCCRSLLNIFPNKRWLCVSIRKRIHTNRATSTFCERERSKNCC